MRISVAAVISAAGSSSRFLGQAQGAPVPPAENIKKEYRPLDPFSPEGKSLTVLGAAAGAFVSCPRIEIIVITVPPGEENGEAAARASIPASFFSAGKCPILFVPGGPTRRVSVHNALSLLESHNPSHVLIHDGARPWISRDLIERTIDAAIRFGAVIPVLPLTETPKELSGKAFSRFPESGAEGGGAEREPVFIKRHLKRAETGAAQTPQGFSFPQILKAHEEARKKEAAEGIEYTDDAEVWGEFMGQVAVIAGDPENKKITYPDDLSPARPPSRGTSEKKETRAQRIGLGRDLHRLTAGRKFLLGGVEIPFEKGELGHSDGDVLSHAVIDAVLGAAGLGDIGELYPPSDPAFKDADSLELLKNAWRKVRDNGWRLLNLDCVVNCERPKILPYRERICRSLALALEAEPGSVFVKGKTNEGIGPLGTGEAVEALAVCLLEKQEKEKPE